MPWQPVLDGDVLPGPPIERIAAGSGGQVDVIVGTNTDDWRLWLVASGAIAGITDEILTGPVRTYGYQCPGDLRAAGRAGAVRLPGEIPGGRPRRSAGGGPDRLVDADPRDPPRRRARQRQRGLGHLHVRVRLGLAGPRRGPRPRGSFVFDTAPTDAPLFGPLLGNDPPQELARTMHAAWVAFAGTGDPGWPQV